MFNWLTKNELIKLLVWVVTYFMRLFLFEAVIVFRHYTLLYFLQDLNASFRFFLWNNVRSGFRVHCCCKVQQTRMDGWRDQQLHNYPMQRDKWKCHFFRELQLSFLKHPGRYQISSFKKRCIILGHMGEFGLIQNIPSPLKRKWEAFNAKYRRKEDEDGTWIWPCLSLLTCQTNCCH